MHVSWTFTGDGILAFAGGALALFGVWWSNHQSIKNVQKQLAEETEAREQETERRTKAVANAMLFEIDSVYRAHIRPARDTVKDWDPKTGVLFDARSISTQPFPIFSGNARSVGGLEDGFVSQIVKFYTAADLYASAVRDYQKACNRLDDGLSGQFGSIPLPSAHAGASLHKAREALKRLKEVSPHLVNMAFLACKKLCERTVVEFSAPVIAVAAENLSVEAIAEAQKDSYAQTH